MVIGSDSISSGGDLSYSGTQWNAAAGSSASLTAYAGATGVMIDTNGAEVGRCALGIARQSLSGASSNSDNSTGAIIGVAVGLVLVALLVVAVSVLVGRKPQIDRHLQRIRRAGSSSGRPSSQLSSIAMGGRQSASRQSASSSFASQTAKNPLVP